MILTTFHLTREQVERWIEWFELAAYEARERYNEDHNDEWAYLEWMECEKQAEKLKADL